MKNFKKILLFLFLSPILPLLGAVGDNTGDKGSPDTKDKTKELDDKGGNVKNKDDDDDDDADADVKTKTYSEAQYQKGIDKIIARERKSWEKKLSDEKKKADMTETERLKAEKVDAETESKVIMAKANSRLIKAEVILQAAKLNIIDPDAAYALLDKEDVTVDDDGNVKGIKEALASLIEEKTYLVGTEGGEILRSGDEQNNTKKKKGGFSMNDLIRSAAGRK